LGNINELYRKLPKMDFILEKFDSNLYSKELLKEIITNQLDDLRFKIKNNEIAHIDYQKIIKNTEKDYKNFINGSLRPVVNATGIVIHTNLGRAPLPKQILNKIQNIICEYSNLEYDLNEGKRGERYHHIKEFISFLTGSENAVIVNNNASAVFLILNTFCKNKNVLVSRGELVEIGGSFRIPDVMKGSGAILKEIGTTNKTKASDYLENADKDTSMIMKVHTSNYKIMGFTENVDFSQIPELARQKNLLSYYDVGSGSFVGEKIGNCFEPPIKDIVKSGFDLISFSGDKMLGGPQAGIIVGKNELIEKIKRNPLMRMLRVDKLTLSILQEILKLYIENKQTDIPAINMLYSDLKELEDKAHKLLEFINKKTISEKIHINITKTKTYTGGGSCPMEEIDTIVLSFKSKEISPNKLEKYFRNYSPPIIGRIKDERFILDVRTIFENQFKIISDAISNIR
jgi:L-seryl-tRNA(Ser) seleniumtransferase